MSLKERLLKALDDTTWGDLPEAALVEVLIEQLKRAKATLSEAQSVLLKEGMRANDMERSARDQIRQLRTDPLAVTYGDFYFLEGDVSYIVSVGGQTIRLARRAGRIDYAVRQISREEYARLQIGK